MLTLADVGIAFLQAFVLTFMLVGLVGLLIPIFPGLVVIWLSTVVYFFIFSINNSISTWGWVILSVSTLLMIFGSVIDNIVIGKKLLDSGTSKWSIIIGITFGLFASIFLTPFIGLLATPAGLYLAEYYRLRDKLKAFESTKAWMIGFGSAFFIRFIIGIVMIALWAIWVFL